MRRLPSTLLLPMLLAACAASRDRDRVGSIEPRAAPMRDSVAALSSGARPGRVELGVVLHREIGLGGASFVLAVARSCRAWPHPAAPRDVLLEVDAEAEHCRVVPYHGPVTISLRRPDGQWWPGAIELMTDDEGRMHTRFGDLDRALAGRGARLDEFTALRVGQGGWAGTYDLARLRGLQAEVHASWVERGRGAPGLFALRHADHPRADHALELALEARLARQEEDFAAVQRGELGAAAFLDRYVWSPLRHRVGGMLIEQQTRAQPED